VVEQSTSPVVPDRPRGRLLLGAVLGSFAVIAALVASASAGAGGPGPTIDQAVQLSAERNASVGIEIDSSGPAFSFEVCIDGVPHSWEGDSIFDFDGEGSFSFGWGADDPGFFDDLPLEADPGAECDMPGFGGGREGHGGLPGLFGVVPDFDADLRFMPDLAPDFEAFEACLVEEGVDPDSPPDRNRASVIVVGPDGRTVVEFGDDIGSVTVTGTEDGVEIATDGGAAVVDVETRRQARDRAFEACADLLPNPPVFEFGFGESFGGDGKSLGHRGHGPMGELFHGLFEMLEVDPDEGHMNRFTDERRSRDLRELLSGVADDGGRCGGVDTQAV